MSARDAGYTDAISRLLVQREPYGRVPSETAAVAVVLGAVPSEGERLLLIRRSERAGDPWSGQVALPGGRVEPEDSSFRDTAVRETREEVGIDLEKGGKFMGYLGSFSARTRRVRVVVAVFTCHGTPAVVVSPEVSSYRWVPFRDIAAPESRSDYLLERDGGRLHFPAFSLGDYLVWGVTERILSALLVGAREPR